MSESLFNAGGKVPEIAGAYALDAVDLAAKNFGLKLDWSEASLQQVEQMLGQLHDAMVPVRPPEDTIWTFSKAFGSYVGEIMRRHHDAEWGMVNMEGKSFPGLQLRDGSLCWPWGKVHGRIINGPEDNVWNYYRVIVQVHDK